jgi:type I restriction enzyme S subunit
VGKVAYVAEDFWPLNTALFVKDFRGNDPLFVCWLLRNFRLERFSRGAGVPTLNRNLVHEAPVVLPKLAAQATFAERATSVAKHRLLLESHSKFSHKLFASLQQRAFRGEL